MNLKKSEDLFQRALSVIPGGVNSPVRAFRSVGGTPVFMKSGDGCRLTDEDGNSYLDFCNSWGPLISGHRHPDIIKAIQNQSELALSFGTPCENEVLLAEYIIENLKKSVPSAEKIRFVNSGTEAVMSALRLARGFTGKNKIIKFDGCYHGHSDSLLVKAGSGLATLGTPDSAGVPASYSQETIVLPLNDPSSLEKAFEENRNNIAAVIIEPVPANNGLLIQSRDFLQFLRDLTLKHQSLLIFDEVISGFRIGFGGAAAHYGITPDLMTYGKIIGGGMPVGGFAGRSEIFQQLAPDGPVYQAGTLSGNPVAMSAGLAQLKLLTEAHYSQTSALAARIADKINGANLEWKAAQIASIFWLYKGKEAPLRANQINRDAMTEYAALFRHCMENGYYIAPSGYEVGFVSSPMTEKDVDGFSECVISFFQSR
ncbi:MAG: glutamate-1-semialdehyde 2,1-aminomutase [Spirochaetia bacterium]|nr:glutamate-1-semialdehyde 2,1-aminomutase [Spirochaetia bacterium]